MSASSPPISLSFVEFVAHYPGTHPRWWRNQIPKLIDAGLVSRVGYRYFIASFESIDAWLLNNGAVAS